jgi:ABC-2 type transport system permease protein
MQVIGMMINNCAFIVVWYLFFQIFTSVNGWGFKEMIGINGFVALVYGIVFTLGNGIRKISKNVTYGQLDKYLALPKDPLLSIILSDAHISAIGDLFFGIISLIIYYAMSNFNLAQVLILPLLVIFSIMIFVGFIITAQSVVFWIPNSEELSDTLFEFMLGPSLYPNSSFTGIVRIFFSFFVPALFISGIPINIILSLNLFQLLLMFGVGLAWLFVSVKIFNLGLKRYESGNLVGMR